MDNLQYKDINTYKARSLILFFSLVVENNSLYLTVCELLKLQAVVH